MEDKIKTVNSALVKAMAAVKENENSQTRLAFVQELLNAKLILPSIIRPEPVDGKVAKDSRMSFFSIKNKEGEKILFLFTSLDELQKWAPAKGKQLLLQNYKQFKEMVVGKNANYDGFVINPYGESITVKRGLIEAIDANVKPMQMKREQVNVEKSGLQPAEFASPGLYAALTDAMVRNETVNAAWMMQVKKEGDNMPTPILVVDIIRGGDMKNTFNSLARVANDFLATGEAIGIMPAYDRVAMKYIKDVQPFYVKGKWGVESHLNK